MLIDRYIFRQTASALVTILISLTLIVWLTSILKEIKLLTAQGQTFLLFLKITSLAIPNLLVTVAPVAFLIAALHTLNRLNGDSELIVLSASGSSPWRLLRPYIFLAALVSAGVLFANVYVLPAASRLLGDYVSQVRTDVISQVLQPGEFSDLDKGLTIHIRDKGENGELLGVVVYDGRNAKVTTTVIAATGEILDDGGRSAMELHDGQIIRQSEGKADAQIVVFQSYIFDIGDFAPKSGQRELKPRERNLWDLMFPDRESAYYKDNKAKLRSELVDRLSSPVYPLFFALLAVVYLGRPKTTREGRATVMFSAFAAGAAIRIAGIAGVNLAGKKLWALALIYGLPAGGALLALAMLHWNIAAPSFAIPRFRIPSGTRFRPARHAKTA